MSYRDGPKYVPLCDRQLTLSVLLELALQRATLSAMLNAVLLLMTLSPERLPVSKEEHKEINWQEEQVKDNESSADALVEAPLSKLLQRVANIVPGREILSSEQSYNTVSIGGWILDFGLLITVVYKQKHFSLIEAYLDDQILPNNESVHLPLRQVAAILMCHICRLGLPYQPDDEVSTCRYMVSMVI